MAPNDKEHMVLRFVCVCVSIGGWGGTDACSKICFFHCRMHHLKEEMEILVKELKCNNSIIERSVEGIPVCHLTAETMLICLGLCFCSLGAANSAAALEPTPTRPSTM